MQTPANYEPLTADTIAGRLGGLEPLTIHLGTDTTKWRTREIGDGNLNLVFIVESPVGGAVIKQALPYVRLVGESWPLPLKRAFFEHHALTRQAARDPGSVPDVYYFDDEQALIIMQYLTPHQILRKSLIAGRQHPGLSAMLGGFCARTLFRGSELHMPSADRKADLALFADNVELCAITENLVFTDPYFAAEMNRHTTPQLDPIVAQLRLDIDLKVEVQHLKSAFCSNAETLLHGDLHTGSVMVSGDQARVIDPEFALYGPIGFDIGMLLGNFLLAYFAQPGHAAAPGRRADYQQWILKVADEIWHVFCEEFSRLWRTERTGILYPKTLYEDQGHDLGAEQALGHRLTAIWQDTLGFAGVEMHRRIMGLAHIEEYETITDDNRRAACEAPGLRLGRHLIVNRRRLTGMAHILDVTRKLGRQVDESLELSA